MQCAKIRQCPRGNNCCGPCDIKPACLPSCFGHDCINLKLRDIELAKRYDGGPMVEPT